MTLRAKCIQIFFTKMFFFFFFFDLNNEIILFGPGEDVEQMASASGTKV